MDALPAEHELHTHIHRLTYQGFTVVPQAIPPDLLRAIRARFDALIEDHANVPTAVVDQSYSSRPGGGSIDINRLFELDPVFEDLMDLPTVFPIVAAVVENDVALLSSAMGNYRAPHSSAATRWHRDGGGYMRLTYVMEDLTKMGGATAVMPGTHRAPHGPPAWANDAAGFPRELPGMVSVGAPAGACLINNADIWHTSTPNRTDRARKIIWVVYMRSHQQVTGHEDLLSTPEFIQRQTDPRRRALLGAGPLAQANTA